MFGRIVVLVILASALVVPADHARADITEGLVGYWPLDGDAQDVSGNGNDGVVIGNVTPVTNRFGVADSAMNFPGSTSDYIDLGQPPMLLIKGAMTVAAWVRADTLSQTGRIIAKQGPSSARSWGLNLETAGHARFDIGVNPTDRIRVDSEPLSFGPDEWWHIAGVFRPGEAGELYINGELVKSEPTSVTAQWIENNLPVNIGRRPEPGTPWQGDIDEVQMYNIALSPGEVRDLMNNALLSFPKARGPQPADGALYADTWVTLSWTSGDFAVSHNIYLSDNFNNVNEGTDEAFRGNQTGTFLVAGFPGYPYTDGLVAGTTYYWRIDEVNEAEPNSPWKGDVWSFTVPPKTAYSPVPADGDEFIDLNVQLSWTAGFGAKVHYIVFGKDFDEVSNAAMGVPNGTTTYKPGPLRLAKTYYWRVDEFDGATTYKGDVWSFTTEGAVTGSNPADGAVDVSPTQTLTWVAGAVAASHEVYFGTDADAVKNATKSSSEYKGAKALGEESYDPGKLLLETTYYWRIDEVNGVNPDSPWAGNVWSFTTGDFFVIDDFEDYDAGENQIWYAWHDGLGYGTPGTAGYYAGNGTGAAVGDENSPSYTEEIIVHGGNQSMPLAYDNDKQGYAYYSEVEYTLTEQRDWSEEGVTELSLWFRGYPASVGSFVEGPAGTYTMTGSGADIWNAADEFHYAFKNISGVGSIQAQVLSVDNTDPWAKAGVMIRETLNAGSKFAAVYITPGNGCRFQARTDTNIAATSDTSVVTSAQTAITAPYWVKLERDVAGNFRGYYSVNGTTWTSMSWNPRNILMSSNIYVGLAVTSHNAAATCEAKFSNVTITGTASAQWSHQDIGILSNAAEPLYVALSNSAGTPAVVFHDNPAAANIGTWTEWIILLQAFADQGIDLTNVDKIMIGMGTRGNMTTSGGAGKMFFDDVRLYR
jgi:hypothetical protein